MSSEQNPTEFPKAYEPKSWEPTILTRWDEANFANPDTCIKVGVTKPDAEPFSIVLPPPNVTGTLHIGHAAMLAIEDTIVRYKRMSGYRTLWLPGTDHAAIATESKVEKILRESENKSRHDLGREAFLDRVKAFAGESHDTIVGQVKRMGSSVDWSREAYTLDDKRSLAVRTAFKKMYDAGIIYRGNRIVNWDPVGQTTISDDEVVYKEETAKFYYLKYGPFEIATARPETKFGDKYVVMHPDDPRYAEYADGQKFTLEWINGPIEATIVKDSAIDMEFGTGVMTITPWHSMIDFELAERHKLDMEPIIDLSGKLLPVAGEFAGLHITEAREQIIAKLESKGLVTKIEENYVHQIATAERTGAVIEPQVMHQWFIGVNREFERDGKKVTLKSLMQDAVRSKKITILPERFEKNYFYWIDNLRDWCISRQIWFGHQIPVWYRGEETYCGVEAPEGEGWTQDPDTLDTWFSSGLWTFSTLGWPDEEEWTKNRSYHPTALLETGYDILFFWVARMILMSEYLLGEIPFKTVYLHGLVRDDKGRKMSKSLGNTINPLDVADEFGADALRLALIVGSTPGNDVKVGQEKFVAMRNFVNKLWNMGRYLSTSISRAKIRASWGNQLTDKTVLSEADQWILFRLHKIIEQVTNQLDAYNLSLAAELLRDFTWNEFADWYIEIHKIEKNDEVILHVYNTLLTLWHPFMPFVTESIASGMQDDSEKLLMVQNWPARGYSNGITTATGAQTFSTIVELITRIRNIRSVYHIDPKETLSLTLIGDESALAPFTPIIERLGRIAEVIITRVDAQPQASASIALGELRAFVHLGDVIDVASEKARLEKEKQNLEKYITGLETRLADTRFTEKAPPAIIEAQRNSLAESKMKVASLETSIKELTA